MDKNCCFQFIILFLLILPVSHVFSQKEINCNEINCNDYSDDKTIGCITFMVEKSKPLADEEIQAEKLAKNQVCKKINGEVIKYKFASNMEGEGEDAVRRISIYMESECGGIFIPKDKTKFYYKGVGNNELEITAFVKGEFKNKDLISDLDIKLINENSKIYPYDGYLYNISNLDKFRINFNSSENGYLNIFYYDELKNEYTNLIQENFYDEYIRKNLNSRENLKIKKNNDFIIFNEKTPQIFFTDSKSFIEYKKLYFVFSKEEFTLPIQEGYTINQQIFNKSLKRWNANKNFQIQELSIKLRKK